jgi:hypothetical protein
MPALRVSGLVAGLLIALGFSLGEGKAANLITNGSFEADLVPSADYTVYPSSGTPSLTGWTVGGVEVAVVNTLFNQNGVQFPAQDGDQWMDLTGENGNSATNNISQAVSGLNVGSVYTLTFYVGSASNNNFYFPSTVNVSLGGVSQGSFTNPSATTTLQWQEFSIDFTPTSTIENIAFFNGNSPNNFSGGLDNITLDLADVPGPPSVPGPLPLLGVGSAFRYSRRLRTRIKTRKNT